MSTHEFIYRLISASEDVTNGEKLVHNPIPRLVCSGYLIKSYILVFVINPFKLICAEMSL